MKQRCALNVTFIAKAEGNRGLAVARQTESMRGVGAASRNTYVKWHATRGKLYVREFRGDRGLVVITCREDERHVAGTQRAHERSPFQTQA